jgi:PAS domain S-box-containing protein
LVNQSLVGIAIIVDGRFSYVNPKFVEMFGYNVEETQVLTIQDISAESDRQLVQEQVRRRVNGETDRADYVFRGRRKNGAEIDVECHSSVMEIGGRPALIDIVLDITARTKAEREMHKLQGQLREQAIHDPLTGLYNRRHLNEFFDRELKLAERHHHPISIVLGDLDHFKDVNDDYGHLAGDEILKVFGDLIKHSFRPSDISCRYGGEEFLIRSSGDGRRKSGRAHRQIAGGDGTPTCYVRRIRDICDRIIRHLHLPKAWPGSRGAYRGC